MNAARNADEHITILLVEDEPAHAEAIRRALSASSLNVGVHLAATLQEYRQYVAAGVPHIALVDLNLPDGRAVDILHSPPETGAFPVLVMTSYGNEQTAVEALKSGALDYVVKTPDAFAAMPRTVERALREWDLLQERVRTESVLRESEERYRTLLSTSMDGFWVADMNGRLREVNDAYCHMIGYRREQLLGMHISDLDCCESAAEVQARIEMLEKCTWSRYETKQRRADGEVIDLEVSTTFQAGRRVFLAFLRDITERNRGEAERKTVIEYLHMINESRSLKELLGAAVTAFQKLSGCEAVGIRLRKGHDYPYAEWRGFDSGFISAENFLCRRCDTGELPRDAAGGPVLACMCGMVIDGRCDPARPFCTGQGSFWSASTSRLLSSCTDEDRPLLRCSRCIDAGYESLALIPLRAAGATMGLVQLNDRQAGRLSRESIDRWERLAGYLAVAIARFNTEDEIRMLNDDLEQRVLQRTAAYEEVNRELESFSYAVSHDLRAPLRHIEGFTNIIQEEYADGLPPEAKDCFGRICAAVGRMNGLIETLLHLSQVTRHVPTATTVDLSGMVRDLATDLAADYPERTVELEVQPDVTAWGDSKLLQVVMENLVGNAWKYTGRNGRAKIEFGVAQEGGGPVYFVRDNGAGFDMKYADKLFEVFQRLHRKDEFEGTGVGLATVRRVLRRMGGSIWAEGEVNKGATFYFTVGSEETGVNPDRQTEVR